MGVFFREVFAMEIFPSLICVMVCLLITNYLSFNYRFVMTIFVSMAIFGISVYCIGLTKKERGIINETVRNIISKTGLYRKNE